MAASSSVPEIPSPPSLLSDAPDPVQTNTHALLLPHQSLFLPEILARLKQHYERYGPIAHWAPVRGFGRVIVVYEEIAGADRAKKEGDWLRLDVDLPAEENHDPTLDANGQGSGTGSNSVHGLPEDGSGSMDIDEAEVTAGPSGFRKGHRRRQSKGPARGSVELPSGQDSAPASGTDIMSTGSRSVSIHSLTLRSIPTRLRSTSPHHTQRRTFSSHPPDLRQRAGNRSSKTRQTHRHWQKICKGLWSHYSCKAGIGGEGVKR